MPNKRASNKQQFGITFTKEEVAKIDSAAPADGITRTEFIRRTVNEWMVNQSKGEHKKNK